VASTNLNVATDSSGIQSRIEEMVTAFNELVEASKSEDLGNDRSLQAVISTLRGKLYNPADATGLYQLGVKTEKDGTLLVDSDKLSAAINDNLDMVQSMMAGNDSSVSGIADQLKAALTSFTSPTTGILASRQSIIERSLYTIDKEIGRGEDRLAAYEEALYAKFSAMEQLVSSLNSQGDYFAQQTAMWSKK
jgi:flagellar hook-associated protein 2